MTLNELSFFDKNAKKLKLFFVLNEKKQKKKQVSEIYLQNQSLKF